MRMGWICLKERVKWKTKPRFLAVRVVRIVCAAVKEKDE